MRCKPEHFWAFLRLGMGWIFLWAFLDKLFGLGFSTTADKAWLAGDSPTFGFLKFGTHGPLSGIFQGLAGNTFVDWVFMLGLLLAGMALILGIGIRIAGYASALMVFFMWLALLPPEHNPILDEHIIYLIILLGLTTVKSGHTIGLGKWWSRKKFVKRHPLLE